MKEHAATLILEIVFLLLWIVIGAALESYQIISHPAYWAGYGATYAILAQGVKRNAGTILCFFGLHLPEEESTLEFSSGRRYRSCVRCKKPIYRRR